MWNDLMGFTVTIYSSLRECQLYRLLQRIGIAGVSVNHLIYKRIREKSMNKYAADILALAGEIAHD